MIAIPFAVGCLAKILLIDPVHGAWFSGISGDNFLLAWCSGMVVQGALMSFFGVPQLVKSLVGQLRGKGSRIQGSQSRSSASLQKMRTVVGHAPEMLGMGILFCMVFSWLSFSWSAQIFVMMGVLVCGYQLMIFMGKVGLAPLGRFATFVMVPGLVIFGFTHLQAIMVAAFVEISGGVAANGLSGQKLGQLARLDKDIVYWMQWLALILCAFMIGGIFWILIQGFGLGGADLVAQKAQSRALLINAYGFDMYALALGVLFGFALKLLKVNASLVLGGLIMPLDWSLLLIVSGLSTYLVKDKEAQYPFWSGVFAASSIWMLLKAIF